MIKRLRHVIMITRATGRAPYSEDLLWEPEASHQVSNLLAVREGRPVAHDWAPFVILSRGRT